VQKISFKEFIWAILRDTGFNLAIFFLALSIFADWKVNEIQNAFSKGSHFYIGRLYAVVNKNALSEADFMKYFKVSKPGFAGLVEINDRLSKNKDGSNRALPEWYSSLHKLESLNRAY